MENWKVETPVTSMKEKKKQYFHTNLQDMDKLSGVVNDVFKTMGQFTMNFKEYLMESIEKNKKKEAQKGNRR